MHPSYLPLNMGQWEDSVARHRAALSALLADRTPFEACDLDLRLRAEDEARERLCRAEAELASAERRCRFTLRHWDGTEEPCWLLGTRGQIVTVRYADGAVQTMDRERFWASSRSR